MITILKIIAKSIIRGKFDSSARFEILMILGRWIFPEYRFKWFQMDWWSQDTFNNYLKKFDEIGRPNCDRRWMLSQLLRLSQKIPGDTAECGVYLGSSSYLICKSNQEASTQKTHHAFDSFQGLSAPTTADGKYWKPGDLSVSLEACKQNLQEFEKVKFYPGWIPTRFAEIRQLQFSFVHVDVDILEPTRDSIEFFYPRLSEGAIFVCDDYGFTSCPGATQAIDQFLNDKIEKMISLPDGGGFFIKGVAV
jgi:O-methyltransferase